MKLLRKSINSLLPSRRAYTIRLRGLIGFTPANLAIFRLAFKHSSQTEESHTSNERLEYLGDAILDSVISDFLFKKYPLKGEGFLTEMRSKIVKRKKLGEIGEKLVLKDFLDYDKTYVNVNSTILGNAVEALIGAIYLDAGYQQTKTFIFKRILKPYIDLDKLQRADINFKSRLFEWAQKYDKELTFEVIDEKMNGSFRVFSIGVLVDGKKMGKGDGRSKKDAQKEAAREAYERLNVAEDLGADRL